MFSFVIIGSLKGRVVPQRGLRQGFPYLFPLCAEEGLSSLLTKAKNDDAIMGFLCNRSAPRQEIFSSLGIGNALTHETYIGLPSLIGRNRRLAFRAGFGRDYNSGRANSFLKQGVRSL